MDALIVAAIITAVGGIIAALIPIFFKKRRDKRSLDDDVHEAIKEGDDVSLTHRQEIHVQRDYTGHLRENPVIVDRPADREGLRIPTVNQLRRIEFQNTRHGSIEFASSFDRQYVVKRTRASLVDEDGLKRLEKVQISASMAGMSVYMATPLKIWKEGDHICELHQFYDGILLKEVVRRNKYRIQGTFLGLLYNCGFLVLAQLHQRGLIHRDATPQNMLMTPDGSVFILDSSFCCRIDSAQRPVFDLDFSPPEQKRGQAVPLSDWFTFAASLYFLANAEPPPLEDKGHLMKGISNIDTGGLFKSNYQHLQNIYMMLRSEIDLRPNSYDDLRLETGTYGMEYELLGVLDLESYGFLVLYPDGIEICNKDECIKVLRGYLGRHVSEELKKDIHSFIEGGNPWLSKSEIAKG